MKKRIASLLLLGIMLLPSDIWEEKTERIDMQAVEEPVAELNPKVIMVPRSEYADAGVKLALQQPSYSYEDLELLARLIHAEAGADYLEEEMKWLVGAVVLNRVASPNFPNTISGVIYQWEPTVQYACTVNGHIEKEPTDLCYEIAAQILENGYDIPSNVVYQAEFKQGSGVYKEVQGMYFCYQE